MQPPAIEWDDAPLKCLSVNEQWMTFLTGMLWLGEQDWYWDADVDRGVQGVRAIIELLQSGECPPVTIPPNLFIAQDQQLPTVHGGGYTAGITPLVYAQIVNIGNYVTDLGGGLFQLVQGTYHIRATHRVVAHNTQATNFRLSYGHQPLFLPQEGDSVRVTANTQGDTRVDRQIVVGAVSTPLRLQLWTDQTRATTGLGQAVSSGGNEIYGNLVITRVL